MRYYKGIFLYVSVCALCMLGGGVLAGQEYGGTSGQYTLAVRPLSAQEFELAPESKTLLLERIAAQFSHVGGFQLVSVQGSSREPDLNRGPDLNPDADPEAESSALSSAEANTDIILDTEIKNYAIETDSKIGYIVKLELLLTLESGKDRLTGLPHRIEVSAIGNGSTSFAAESRAIGDISNEFRRALLASPVVTRPAVRESARQPGQPGEQTGQTGQPAAPQKGTQTAQQAPGLRISDTLAGRVVLNQGEKAGIRRGGEYGPANGDKGLVKVAAVYPEFAEGHVVYGRDVLLIGTLMEQRGKGRLRTALEGTYFYRSDNTESPAEHLGGLSARIYYDRDLFSISPLMKADLLSNQLGFLQTGVALNWHAGRCTIEPALLGGFGFTTPPIFALFGTDTADTSGTNDSTDESGSLYWGGSIELGWTVRINQAWLFLLDFGMSGWYYTGDAVKEVRFMYVGSGFMLKY
ncbi:MAG: hypothetical protein R6V86_04120 [Spirochaetia bacterium]